MEEKLAIDKAAQFDNIVGFLDEEQTPKIYAERTQRSRWWAMCVFRALLFII
jgi:hypothetical protein